jgi:hypothetical protein
MESAEESPSALQPPAMLGTYLVENGELVFVPRFPLIPGKTYHAWCDLGAWGSPPDQPVVDSDLKIDPYVITAEFKLPGSGPRSTTNVSHVFPTASTLPENLLKLYIHFSAPMGRGEAYRRVHLLDAVGKEIEGPFLELDQELWNDDQTRFTLFFDPGRIKRELLPRELVGPALEAGKKYTLVIDGDWRDAEGRPLQAGFKKQFQVGPPDEKQPDVKTWKLIAPAAGSTDPLVVDFPEALDHALLERVLRIVDEQGQVVPGMVSVANEETRWRFTPTSKWAAGSYQLEAETILEDLAGNNLGRPFEVDLFRPIERRVEAQRVRVPFRIQSEASR